MDWALLKNGCLLAQEGQGGLGPMMLPFSILMIFALYLFLVQQPKAKREQHARQEMLKNLKKNDHVLTAGGIYGVVTNVQSDADEVTIRVDDATNTRLRITLSSVARVLGDGSPAEKPSGESKKEAK